MPERAYSCTIPGCTGIAMRRAQPVEDVVCSRCRRKARTALCTVRCPDCGADFELTRPSRGTSTRSARCTSCRRPRPRLNRCMNIQCTRPECTNTGVAAAPTSSDEYLCGECACGWVYAACKVCDGRELVRSTDLLRWPQFDSMGERSSFHICAVCSPPKCRRCCVTRVPCSGPESVATAASDTCTTCTDPPTYRVVCQHDGCSVERVVTEGSREEFLCAEHQSVDACGVCGEPAGGMRYATHMQPYTRFALCESCTTARGQLGGDLLELAQSSMANIVAASKLAQYVSDLENDTSLWYEMQAAMEAEALGREQSAAAMIEAERIGGLERAELRQVLHAPARDAINQHMHVHDDEKVQLAESYRDAVRYAGHCCATCGVRDPASAYTCKMFSLRGQPCSRSGYLRRRGDSGTGAPMHDERLVELPQWLFMSCMAAQTLEAHTCELYIPKYDDPDSFEAVQVTALDLHHVMDTHAAAAVPGSSSSDQQQDASCHCGSGDGSDSRRCGKFLHVVEEAVEILHDWEWGTKSRSGVFISQPDVTIARFWVCQACECGFVGRAARDDAHDTDPAPQRYSDTAPRPSFASGADFGRAYLTQRVAMQTTWREAPLQCRLPVASPLETALLSSVRLHISAVTISTGNGRASSGGYEVMRKHTVYFPQSLMDESNRTMLQPLQHADDAAEALRIAVEGVRVVLVGPEGEWGRLEQRALAVTDFTLRPEVVFNQLQLHALAQRLGSDTSPHDMRTTNLCDEDLQTLRDALTADKLASLLHEVMVRKGVDEGDEAEAEKHASDVAGVRATDDAPISIDEVQEMDDTAACADADGGIDSMFSAIGDTLLSQSARREIRRGTDPFDDYNGLARCLYESLRPLFPLGRGLTPGKCLSPSDIRRMLLFYDPRFAQSSALNFSLADIATRHNVNKCVGLKAKSCPQAFAKLKALMANDEFQTQLKEACQDPHGALAREVLTQLLPFVHITAAAVPYSDEKRAGFQGIMMSFQRYYGAGHMFASWAPDDVHDPDALRDTFAFRGVGKFPHLLQGDRYSTNGASDTTNVLAAFQRGETHEVYGDFGIQSLQQRASRNPVAVTEHFYRRTEATWEHLLGVSMARRKTCPFTARPKGALGRLAAMQYVTECNGRKSLHIHALTYGSMLPEFVARVAHDPSLRHAVLAALDTQVTGQLPTEYHMLNACRKALRVGTGYDASFPLFLTSHSHSTDAPIKIEHVRQCGRAVAMNRNMHTHHKSCQKPKRGIDGCRFCAPWAHGFEHSRCLQLTPMDSQSDPTDEWYEPSDARWCRRCVVPLKKAVVQAQHPMESDRDDMDVELEQMPVSAPGRDRAAFRAAVGAVESTSIPEKTEHSAEWQTTVRERICERELFYHPVPIAPLTGRLALITGERLHDRQQAQREVQRLREPDNRCLVLEVARPCTNDGYATMPELMGALERVLDQPSVRLVKEKLAEIQRDDPDALELLEQINATSPGCANGNVTSFCELISAALGCNTAIYTLGAGASAKAAGCYLSKYASKRQHDRQHTTLVIAYEAAKHLRAHPSTADDSGTSDRSAKHLSQRILNAGTEMAATEAATINLHTARAHRRAEVTSEKTVYIDAWGVCRRASELAHRQPHVLGKRTRVASAMADGVPDVRERFGIDSGEAIPTEQEYEKIYKVNGRLVMATQAQHYAYRSVELAHLNALEFFMLYDVQKRKADTADTPSGSRRGRPANVSYEFMDQHPLAGHYTIVRRSKLMLPLLAGAAAPRQPRKGARAETARKGWGRWARFYAAVLIPWGYHDSATMTPGTTARHHTPRLQVTQLLEWWRSMELQSVVAWARNLLRSASGSSTAQVGWVRRVLGRLRAQGATWVDSYMEPFEAIDRQVGPSPATPSTFCLGSRFAVASYRLATLENMSGAFDTSGTDMPGIQHRSQSRDLWGRHGVPDADGGGLAWDADEDEVADMIREDETNCNMLQTLRSGRDFFAAMKRASAASMLQDQLRAKLENTAAGTQPDRCDQRTWHGTSAPRGYNPAACQAAATELRKPFTGTSAQHDMPPIDGGAVPAENPFSDDSTCETEDGAVLHERQRAAGRHFLACVRTVPDIGVADGQTLANLTSLCMGAAGTGKSKMIHALLRQIQREVLGRVIVTGYTGVSCSPFLTPTIMTLFNLSMKLSDRNPRATELEKLRTRFKTVAGFDVNELKGLVIDEVSFIQPELLGRVSRLLKAIRGSQQVMGGIAVMLAGHMFQLPPVKAAGTWFLDLLWAARRDRGDNVGATKAREQTRNFAEGLRVLRAAKRFDLTHNFRAERDPDFAAALDTLCNIDADASLAPVLDSVTLYDATDQQYQFGPFAVLSNVERQFINQHKLEEYAKFHRLPILRWKWPVPGLDLDSELYEHEPGLWGYFVEGAPVQLNVTFNSSRGAANGSQALMHSLQFTSTPRRQVLRALAKSGSYTGPTFLDIDYNHVGNLVLQMSGADWHGVPLPDLRHVLPPLPDPVTGADVHDLAVIPLRDPGGERREVKFCSVFAAQHNFRSAKPAKCTFELAFAVTDYKLQGMTLERLVIVAGTPALPLRHTRSSAYVQLSRVRQNKQNRLLLLDAEARGILERVEHREELLVFEQAYGPDGLFCAERALAAYDEIRSHASSTNTRRRLDFSTT